MALAPFLVAGIVNITPDSFSDGNRWFTPEKAAERIRQTVDEGADIVDLGAESTRPGAEDIGDTEEWRRLEPALREALSLRRARMEGCKGSAFGEGPGFALAVDSFRAATAARALAPGEGRDEGVDIINDVSGCLFDPAMPEVLAQYKPGYVLGHSPVRPAILRQCPAYGDVVEELLRWFTTRMTILVKAGLPEACICLDPCIGFGKNLEHSLAIFGAIPRLASLGRPLYFGISRKSVLPELLGENPGAYDAHRRDVATQALVALLARAGVAVHRVHQVADTITTLSIVQSAGL